MELCLICCHNIQSHSYSLKCCLCLKQVHYKCLPNFSKKDYDYSCDPNNYWSCPKCNRNLFPFYDDDDDIFLSNLKELQSDAYLGFHIDNVLPNVFSPFDFCDSGMDDPLTEIDPDSNFYNMIGDAILNDSLYYSVTSLAMEMNNDKSDVSSKFSLIHANIRSARKNIDSFKYFLSSLSTEFTCIGLSETWLTEESFDSINIGSYRHIGKYRSDRIGGGVSILLKDHIQFQTREDISVVTPFYESIFIEIDKSIMNTHSNVVIGVIYRIPGSDINVFNDYYKDVLHKIHLENKIGYIMGDFNINLLNNDHAPTNDFLDVCFSYSFLPLITRPTRITQSTSSLIDNIFTNDIQNNNYYKGIFVSDVSDHYPVFFISQNIVLQAPNNVIFKRNYSTANIEIFRTLLLASNLDNIFSNLDPNDAIATFNSIIKYAHDKAFPLKKVKMNYTNKKPWLTNSLKEAIKRKNKLFINLKNNFSSEKEVYYKKYKSELNRLLRKAEKDFLHELLYKHKNNMKKTWNIVKNVINSKKKHACETVFKHNNVRIVDPQEIVEKFNNYFVNIGSSLASKIENVNTSPQSYMSGNYSHNFFISNR